MNNDNAYKKWKKWDTKSFGSLTYSEKIYYESKVRINNDQNIVVVILLGLLHFLNFYRNRLLLLLGIKKSLNW